MPLQCGSRVKDLPIQNFSRFVLTTMPTIVNAREWRCKWPAENNKKSLATAYQAMAAVSDKVTAVDGNLGVVCHVCGECLEFNVIISVRAEKFGAWEAATFAPEKEFLDALKRIEGIVDVEAVTYGVPEANSPAPSTPINLQPDSVPQDPIWSTPEPEEFAPKASSKFVLGKFAQSAAKNWRKRCLS